LLQLCLEANILDGGHVPVNIHRHSIQPVSATTPSIYRIVGFAIDRSITDEAGFLRTVTQRLK